MGFDWLRSQKSAGGPQGVSVSNLEWWELMAAAGMIPRYLLQYRFNEARKKKKNLVAMKSWVEWQDPYVTGLYNLFLIPNI